MQVILVIFLGLFGAFLKPVVCVAVKTNESNSSIFSFDDDFYHEWSNWSECSTACKSTRERSCYTIPSLNYKSNCKVEIIREIKSCFDNEHCGINNITISTKTLNVLPFKCGRSSYDKSLRHKIIGGKPSNPKKWPWVVSFGYIFNKQVHSNCGATLISARWALTAAHCIRPYIVRYYNNGALTKVKRRRVLITIGKYHKNKFDIGERNIYISHIIVHPNYVENDETTIYDFVLLRLQTPIGSERDMDFPCISADSDFQIPDNSICYALGWGNQYNENDKSSFKFDDRLQEVQLPLLTQDFCQEDYVNIIINYTVHVCAGANQKDSCVGDSGGGLYCLHPISKKWMLFGVISFGNTLGCGKTPGVYARISAIVDWISQTVRAYSVM